MMFIITSVNGNWCEGHKLFGALNLIQRDFPAEKFHNSKCVSFSCQAAHGSYFRRSVRVTSARRVPSGRTPSPGVLRSRKEGTWLVPWEEFATFGFGVVSLSPYLGCRDHSNKN